MTVVRWDETNRERLGELLPEAVVVVPTGATEQHGPHLPTGTDQFMAQTIVARATAGREFPRPIIIGPTVAYGASDHHLAFGGTLSMSVETFTAVIVDIARSVSTCGGKRLVFINGHGGNQGALTSAAATASNHFGMAVAWANYWDLIPAAAESEPPRPQIAGHAGGFETSLILAVRPELVAERGHRELPNAPVWPPKFVVQTPKFWQAINGHTDTPEHATGEVGELWIQGISDTLAERLTELANTM